MGQAKMRGSKEERIEQARQQRAKEIEDTKREMGLPPDSTFVGYVVFVPEKDDYLREITEDDAQIRRTYCKSPELAVRYMERQYAEKVAQSLPREAVVGLLYDTGKQLAAIIDK